MKVAIIGAGTIGTQLALRCSSHGCATTLIARDPVRAAAALDAASRESGLPATDIAVGSALSDAAGADVIAEAIPEELEAKRALYRQLETIVGAHVPIASGTSSFVPDALGVGLAAPGRVIVAHMVHPVTVVPIVELIAPTGVDAAALASVEAWLARLRMRPVRLRAPITGFIVNRLQFALVREAARLVEAGIVDAADVDAVVECALGPRWAATGPLASVDLGGRRTFAAVARSVVPDLDARASIPLLEVDDAPLREWDNGTLERARARRRRVYDAIENAR
ncbi:MAG TPA: 3-hydroxyacyl-CoA dehydrogenase NAD-binding domain-containing protein [Candidatus Acidoferrum sp.]|nr:3-hydroxyacyl-CoA dehydrogenase NAD-binding domain-containing protein [Candidatus Acidoferrum sp.]